MYFIWTRLSYSLSQSLNILAGYDFYGPNRNLIWKDLPIDRSYDDVIINAEILNGHPIFSVFIHSNNFISHNHIRINTRSNKYLISRSIGNFSLNDEVVISSLKDHDSIIVLTSDKNSLRVREYQPTPYSFEEVSNLMMIRDEAINLKGVLDDSLDIVLWKNSNGVINISVLKSGKATRSFQWPLNAHAINELTEEFNNQRGVFERSNATIDNFSSMSEVLQPNQGQLLPSFDPLRSFGIGRKHFSLNIARKDVSWEGEPKLKEVKIKEPRTKPVTAIDRYNFAGSNDPRLDGLIKLRNEVEDQLPARRGHNVLHQTRIPDDYQPILYTIEEAKRDAEKVLNAILDEEILSRGKNLSSSKRIKIRERLKQSKLGKSVFDDITDAAYEAMQARREAERPWMERAEHFDRYSGRAGQQFADDIVRIITAIRERIRENEAIQEAIESAGKDTRKGVEGTGAPIRSDPRPGGPIVLPA